MNVPRLNSKGVIMTLSGTGGRLNIFQRIVIAAKQEIEGEGVDAVSSDDYPGGIDDGLKYATKGSLL